MHSSMHFRGLASDVDKLITVAFFKSGKGMCVIIF